MKQCEKQWEKENMMNILRSRENSQVFGIVQEIYDLFHFISSNGV